MVAKMSSGLLTGLLLFFLVLVMIQVGEAILQDMPPTDTRRAPYCAMARGARLGTSRLGAPCAILNTVSRNIFGYAFSNSKEVVDYVTELAPLLCLSFIVDGFSAVLGGVARGSGWQHIGAWANVVAYYLIGAPVGLFLAFWCHMNGKGLWIGVIFGSSSQGIILAIVTACMSWNEQASKARKRIVVGTSSFGNGIA